jgi:hypothetical protein
MKLTIDKVRAARHAIDNPDDACAYDTEILRALCDEWIAARTVRWSENTLETDERDRRVVGAASERTDGAIVAYMVGASGVNARFATLATARAWLEEQARASGFEVAT